MFRPVLIHLLCICIGADSGDSADSTFSVTAYLQNNVMSGNVIVSFTQRLECSFIGATVFLMFI